MTTHEQTCPFAVHTHCERPLSAAEVIEILASVPADYVVRHLGSGRYITGHFISSQYRSVTLTALVES